MQINNATSKPAADDGAIAQNSTDPGKQQPRTPVTTVQPPSAPVPIQTPATAPSWPKGVFAINDSGTRMIMRGSQAGTASTTTTPVVAPSQGTASAAAASSTVTVGEISVEVEHFTNLSVNQTEEEYRMIRAYSGQLMQKLYAAEFSGPGWTQGKNGVQEGDIILSHVLDYRADAKEPDEDAINWIFILGGILMVKPRPAWVFELSWRGMRCHGTTTFGNSKVEEKWLKDYIRGERRKLEDYIQFQEENTELHVPTSQQCRTDTIWFNAKGGYSFLLDGKAPQRFVSIYDDYEHPWNVPYKIIGSARSVRSLQAMQLIEDKKCDYRKAHAKRVVEKRIFEVEEEERQAEERRRQARRHENEERCREDARQLQIARELQKQQDRDQRERDAQAYRDNRSRDARRGPPPTRNATRAPQPRDQERRDEQARWAARQRDIPREAPQPRHGQQGSRPQQRPMPLAPQPRSEVYNDYDNGLVTPPAFTLHPSTKRKAGPAKNTRNVRPAPCGVSTLAGHVNRETDLNKVQEEDEDDKENRGENEGGKQYE